MGFIRDIRKIVALVPAKRQTLFFSATMAPEIARLAADMLDEPVRVEVTPAATTVERIEQRAIRVEKAAKPARLVAILRDKAIDRALVFTRTKHGADRVVRHLRKEGLAAEAIHGNKTQGNRERTMAAFRSGEIRTLVATDIAARGIDVDGVSHVVNFDLPNIPDTYVHRIGRTARAGADGVAVSLVSGEEMPFLKAIEKLIRRTVPMEGEAPRVLGEERHEAHREAPHGERSGRGKRRRRRGPSGAKPGAKPGREGEARREAPHHRGGRSERASNGPSPHSRPGEGIAAVGFMAAHPRRGR
jgi:superfamily II DNA/RNA helicase